MTVDFERTQPADYLTRLAAPNLGRACKALVLIAGQKRPPAPVVGSVVTRMLWARFRGLGLTVHRCAGSSSALSWRPPRVVGWLGAGHRGKPGCGGRDGERGIDISTESPKPWTDAVGRAADVVVTMGCGDACPYFPGERYEEWTLEDPAGLGVEAVRPIRDEIERRVRHLLDELDVSAQA